MKYINLLLICIIPVLFAKELNAKEPNAKELKFTKLCSTLGLDGLLLNEIKIETIGGNSKFTVRFKNQGELTYNCMFHVLLGESEFPYKLKFDEETGLSNKITFTVSKEHMKTLMFEITGGYMLMSGGVSHSSGTFFKSLDFSKSVENNKK